MNNSEQEISQSLQKVLDSNGFSFQYSVINRVIELYNQKKSIWFPLVSELPVIVNNKVTHLDIVLKYGNSDIYMIVECKRADPATSNWSFVKAPFTMRDDQPGNLYFDYFMRDDKDFYFYGACLPPSEKIIYHLGFELKTGAKGEGNNTKINDALEQSFRSSSGYINHLLNNQKLGIIKINKPLVFIPAIFTTARLWASNNDISKASIDYGNLPPEGIKAVEKDWIWFNSNRSKFLMAEVKNFHPTNMVYMYNSREFIRSTAIVGSAGLEDFLSMDINDWVTYYCKK